VVLFKLALLGYLYGITSERRLAEEARLHLAYRWFLGYDLDETPPDHSVLSKARARFGVTAYHAFFTEIVRQCEQAGLLQVSTLYLDSTLVEANASLDSVGSRALVAQLTQAAEYLAALWQANPVAPSGAEAAPPHLTTRADPPNGPAPGRPTTGPSVAPIPMRSWCGAMACPWACTTRYIWVWTADGRASSPRSRPRPAGSPTRTCWIG